MEMEKEILILIQKIHKREEQMSDMVSSLNERVFELEKTQKPEKVKE